jgi:hypothetical protein
MLSTGTFPCPHCNEFISAGVTQCRHCSAQISPEVGETAVRLQDTINKAVNEASSMRYLVGGMWGSCLLGIYAAARSGRPFNIVSLFCWSLTVAGFTVSGISLALWQVRYRSISSADIDCKRAKRNWTVSALLWLFMLMILLLLASIGVSILFPR